ncbi:hypothetical protein PTSG_02386 [Salpingoeca rosetta]|uniref:Uncharacterized protein n=1 Tax=Salpingoeca rosetta (strain ATCC 50818 / BSB-021) TaxID=946362 RepID=F2U220_SALR5|nr:uncharacterized protein PTSG_02386 [Salpingoeca rosetta]EGD81672.1 hypothetical protein PTSG_02386 [Salpingoeca rosetta]|eukprot:XP_004996876.1 hypothetical protein PTSG_02386 [Salpingoeca rosetta]
MQDIQGFECTDGVYRKCTRVALPRPVLSPDERADLAPPPTRLSFCVIRAAAAASSRPSTADQQQENGDGDAHHAHASNRIHGSHSSHSTDIDADVPRETTYMAFNCRRMLFMSHSFGPTQHFTYDSTCSQDPIDHDFNHMTRSPDSTELACCFTSGAVVVYNVITGCAMWINRKEEYTAEPGTAIAWLPGRETELLVGHTDGTVYLIDTHLKTATQIDTTKDTRQVYRISEQPTADANPRRALVRNKPAAVSAIACSPDSTSVAITYMDGLLLVVSRDTFASRFVARSYYGGFTSVAWSDDCRFIATGGEDDLVSIWSVEEKDIIARCVGHRSFVSAVAFDSFFPDIVKGVYRIGSVGQDGCLLMWSFSLDTLPPPVAARSAPRPAAAVVNGSAPKEQQQAKKGKI